MFCQIENTRGIVVRIKQRQRRQISNSTIRKIPPLVKYSKHRTKLPRKQLGKWTWYKNVCHKKPIWVYIIEYLEIDTKSKHRVWKKIIAVPFPFDRSCENLEPRRFVAYRRSKIRSISPTDFSSFRWKIEKKNPSVRPPIDSRSLPLFLIFLDSASSKKKGGRKRKEKKKKEYKEKKGKEIDSFVNHLFSRDKLNFFRVGGGGAEEKGLHRERARVKEARLIFIPDAAPEGTVFLLDAEGLGYRGGLSRGGEEGEAERRGRWISEGMEREAKGVATPEESSKCFSTYPRRGTVYRLGECAVSVCCFAFGLLKLGMARRWLGTDGG